MVAETEVIQHVQFTCVADVATDAVVAVDLAAAAQLERRSTDVGSDPSINPVEFVPSIRSGSFADIGQRRYMEDEHIRIDDLASHLGPLLTCPSPTAFYGVFDGHGGADAAVYMKRHALRFLFEDGDFPQWSESDDDEMYIESVESSVRRAFLQADLALSDEASVSRSSGTTALTALVLGSVLLVANAGDCRAVLSRKGTAIELSHDHRPAHTPERERVMQCGGFIDDGYLNGVLSVTRALGDWDLKCPDETPGPTLSPLIAEPELKQATLTPEDEFMIIGCDGIWDVLSSQQAVSFVRRGLRRHDDPDKSARDLASEALRLNSCDNLTVIVVCFSSSESFSTPEPVSRLRCCKSISVEALCKLKSWLDRDSDGDADN